jgi:hypothetical protein
VGTQAHIIIGYIYTKLPPLTLLPVLLSPTTYLCYFENSGAYTGAVSTCMLKDVGAKYVLCGHSERRSLFRDDDGAINKKVKKVLKEGLTPVLCIGETEVKYPII